MPDQTGRPAGIVGSASKRFDALLLASASIVWWTNAAGEFVDAQPYWQAYTGQSWDEYQGSRWVSCLHPDDKAAIMEDWARAVDTGGPYFTEGRIWSAKHKAYRAFQTRGIAVRDERGVIYEWLGALTDVQDTIDIKVLLEATKSDLARSLKNLRVSEALSREQAAQLQASEERLRLALEGADLGSWDFDLVTGQAVWNRRHAEMQGYADHQGPANMELWKARVHPGDLAAVTDAFEHALKTRTRVSAEHRTLRADSGEERWMQLYGAYSYDDDGMAVRLSGVSLDVTDRKRQEANIQLLMREVNHRSKNLLGLVQSIARHTVVASPEEFLDRFGERVRSLAASQDLLVKGEWKAVALAELVRSQLAFTSDLIGTRIRIEGSALNVLPVAAQPLGMALHELATNAFKHGALSTGEGRVRIAWAVDRCGSEPPVFTLDWQEEGGPPVTPPRRSGFGRTVLTSLVRMALGCEPALSFDPAGFSWHIRCQLDRVVDSATHGLAAAAGPRDTLRENEGARILVVDDEPLIALEIADILTKAGYGVIGPAGSVAEALALLQSERCAAAVLDVNLGRETCEPIAEHLVQRSTPYVIVSGYSREQQALSLRAAPYLAKPVVAPVLIDAVRRLVGMVPRSQGHVANARLDWNERTAVDRSALQSG
jgi:PAS domain S-box-containing protein